MPNEDKTVWVTYNGEIYNFQEIKTELQKKGHVFKTHCDTEVLVHGYEEWGSGLLSRLRGMFAFAIFDQKRQKLFLARDRLGIKPLIYYSDDHTFIFSSEIKAIVNYQKIDKSIDFEATGLYFEYGYIPAPYTIFKNVFKLKPGHYIELDLTKRLPIVQTQYWHLDFTIDSKISESEATQKLSELLDEAVKIRLISDVPIGGLLSGGMDSSTIVNLMVNNATDRVKTFSIGFEEEKFSETFYSKQLADYLDTEHHEFIVKPDIKELLPKLVYHFDEPFSDASAIPTYYVCKMARQNVTVCLSGDGGDEIFAGYESYRHCLGLGRFDILPQRVRSLTFGSINKLFQRPYRGRAFIEGLSQSPNTRFVSYMKSRYGAINRNDFLSKEALSRVNQHKSIDNYLDQTFNNNINDVLHRYLDLDIHTYLPNDILQKVDITSMMNSLEVRVPLLDHKFVEFAATLPSFMKFRNNESKYILRKVMANILPREILSRGKMGFGVPLRDWIAGDLKNIVDQYLFNKSKQSGLFDYGFVEKIVNDNKKKRYQSTISGKLWWIIFFEMWYQDVYSN